MSTNKNNSNKKTSNNIEKFLKTTRNIYVNLRRIIKNKFTNIIKNIGFDKFFKKFKKILIENRFLFIIISIVLVFISKNLYTLNSYSKTIKDLEKKREETELNLKTLENDLKYYNTDEFIIRYAIENLNMRPTEKNPLIHLDIIPSDENSDTNNEASSNENSNTNNETSSNENSNTNNEVSSNENSNTNNEVSSNENSDS